MVGQLLKGKGEHIFTVVFEVENIDDARVWILKQGFEIRYECDNGTPEKPADLRQISVSPERTHGMLVTLLERGARP